MKKQLTLLLTILLVAILTYGQSVTPKVQGAMGTQLAGSNSPSMSKMDGNGSLGQSKEPPNYSRHKQR